MGRRVLEILPVPPIALQLRTGIAMLSYADNFIFGITADYDTAPDIEALAAGIEDGVAQAGDDQPRTSTQARIARPEIRSRRQPLAKRTRRLSSGPSCAPRRFLG